MAFFKYFSIKGHNFIPEYRDDIDNYQNFKREVKYNGNFVKLGFLKHFDKNESEYE